MESKQKQAYIQPRQHWSPATIGLLVAGAVVFGFTVWPSGNLNPVLSFTVSLRISIPGIIFFIPGIIFFCLRKIDNENQEKEYQKFTYTSK